MHGWLSLSVWNTHVYRALVLPAVPWYRVHCSQLLQPLSAVGALHLPVFVLQLQDLHLLSLLQVAPVSPGP